MKRTKRKETKRVDLPTTVAPDNRTTPAQAAEHPTAPERNPEYYFGYYLFQAACLFRHVYNGFIVALLSSAKWNSRAELEAQGYTLVDIGLTITPPGSPVGVLFRVYGILVPEGSQTDLCYVSGPHDTGLLVTVPGSHNTLFSMNRAEGIAFEKQNVRQQQERTNQTHAATGTTEQPNSFLEFCKAHLVSDRGMCAACRAKVGWRTTRVFGSDDFRVGDLVRMENDQTLPLCLLFFVATDSGVLLSCDYDTALARYKAAEQDVAPGTNLFKSEWLIAVFTAHCEGEHRQDPSAGTPLS